MPKYTVTVGCKVDVIAANPVEAAHTAVYMAKQDPEYIELLSMKERK